jgi:hypothetical protein
MSSHPETLPLRKRSKLLLRDEIHTLLINNLTARGP